MKLYCDGESMAFEVIYSRHQSKVYSYLQKRIHDKNILDDLFQSVFVKFHKSRHNYNPEFVLLKWLYTICRSEFLDHLKKKKVDEVEFKEKAINDVPANELELPFDLATETSLSAREKDALALRYYSEQDFFDISKQLKTSSQNTRKIISRALKKLRNKYGGIS